MACDFFRMRRTRDSLTARRALFSLTCDSRPEIVSSAPGKTDSTTPRSGGFPTADPKRTRAAPNLNPHACRKSGVARADLGRRLENRRSLGQAAPCPRCEIIRLPSCPRSQVSLGNADFPEALLSPCSASPKRNFTNRAFPSGTWERDGKAPARKNGGSRFAHLVLPIQHRHERTRNHRRTAGLE